jgi:hypothetical protein
MSLFALYGCLFACVFTHTVEGRTTIFNPKLDKKLSYKILVDGDATNFGPLFHQTIKSK